MRMLALALTAGSVLVIPAAAQAQNPLSAIFNCDNPGNRQGTGAVVGGVLGGLLGNTLAGDNDETLGTVLGAAIGAGLGSYIGCNMTGADETRAEDATRRALDQGRSTTWTNAQTGRSGRIDIVNTFYRENVQARVPDPYYRGNDPYYGADPYNRQPTSLNQVRFARGVQFPANYRMSNERFRAEGRVNVRAAPDTRGAVLTTLRAGERFDALARVNNDWLLVGRNGEAVGYVASWVVTFDGYSTGNYAGGYGQTYGQAYGQGYGYTQPGYQTVTERQLCRTFDQTVQQSGYRPTTQRFTACQDRNGQWLIQS